MIPRRVSAAEIVAQVDWTADPPLLRELQLAECAVVDDLDLTGVTIRDVACDHTTFHGDARFTDCSFLAEGGFSQSRFVGVADFDGAHFEEGAFFMGASFGEDARFAYCIFGGEALFGAVRFAGPSTFRGAAFGGPGSFSGARFAGSATFEGTAFASEADLGTVTFAEDVDLGGMTLQKELRLNGSRFERAPELVLRAPSIALSRVTFAGTSRLAATTDVLQCSMLHCPEGVSILVTPLDAQQVVVTLDRTRLDATSVLAGPPGPVRRASVVSLRGAEAAHLTLTHVDLSACLFRGAHNLDKLRIDGATCFVQPPPGWTLGWPWPWPRRWTRRNVLAEESLWRSRQTARRAYRHRVTLRWPELRPMRWPGWQFVPATAQIARWPIWWWNVPDPPRSDLEPADYPEPAEIAATYRALRKGREDHRDEPGASDFYYGEMEMRRAAGRESGVRLDGGLLFLYWLVSGYALRAGRAFMTLVAIIAVFAMLFELVGFATAGITPRAVGVKDGRVVYANTGLPQRSDLENAVRALTYSAGTATAIGSAPERRLTTAGEVLRMLLRILGPILIALVALAIRGRIKR